MNKGKFFENGQFTRKLSLWEWLAISCSFSCCLLITRIICTGRLSYGFLAWNLFLASVPYFISSWLVRHPGILRTRVKLCLLVFAWLIFMPNSFYILTDLFHLDGYGQGRSWFDLTLILSFAWNGILFGVLSIQKMEELLKKAKGRMVSMLTIGFVFWLNAFGIYLGRFLRFNSWNVITDPLALFSGIGNMILDPYEYRYVWSMSFFFGFLMLIIYQTIRKLGEE